MSLESPTARLLAAAAALVAIAASLYFTFGRGGSGQVRPSPQMRTLADALCETAAREAAAACGGHGTVVLLVPPPGDGLFPTPFTDCLAARLPDHLRQAGFAVDAPESVAALSEDGSPRGGCTREALAALFAKHADAVLLLSLAGLPALTAADVNAFPAKRPKLAVVSNALMPAFDRTPAGAVAFGIIARESGAAGKDAPPGAFDTFFRVVRPGQR